MTTVIPFRNAANPARTEGRLTALSGDPIPSGNGAHGPILYFTPYRGNRISLFVGGVWQEFAFSEISIDSTGLGLNDTRDVFIYFDGTNLVLEFSQEWTGFVTRIDALAYQDGVLVKASDPTRKFLGTIVAVSAGHLTFPTFFFDTANARLISNLYNAVPRTNYIYIPGAIDADALTDTPVDSLGRWVVPLYLGGEPAYFQWCACEPRMVRVDAHVTLRTSTATIIGAGIGMTPGDDNWDVRTIVHSTRTTESRINDNMSVTLLSPVGAWIAWQAFFAEGGDGRLYSEITDKRRGAVPDPALSWITSWIDC